MGQLRCDSNAKPVLPPGCTWLCCLLGQRLQRQSSSPPHRTLHAAAPQEAVAQLQQLTERRPGDADVWRVLAESQAGLGDQPAAIASYRRAWQEVQEAGSSSRSALDVLQGLAGQLVASGQEQQVWRGGAWLAAARQRGWAGGRVGG